MFWNYLVSLCKKSADSQSKRQSGFGLVELMVSISIMVIVSAIILTQQGSFNGAILLRGEAYDIALQLREIQLSAVSASSDGSGEFRSVLGAQFYSNASFNHKYPIFRDADGDGFYDGGEEFGIQGILDKRFEIRTIRVDGATTTNPVAVIFERPNFDAIFVSSAGNLFATSVEIDIARKGVAGFGDGVLRTIEITSTGQIAVK